MIDTQKDKIKDRISLWSEYLDYVSNMVLNSNSYDIITIIN